MRFITIKNRLRQCAQHRTYFCMRGFTIVEVMVSVAIIALISSVVMFQYKNFDSKLLLRNVAYEIAISLRSAQIYGISVRGSGGAFQTGYGVHFDNSTPTSYTTFIDLDNSGTYNNITEKLETGTIDRNNQISDLCVSTGGAPVCGKASLDMIFVRPDPDAKFAVNSAKDPSVAYAIIDVAPKTAGALRQVYIYASGQISIK